MEMSCDFLSCTRKNQERGVGIEREIEKGRTHGFHVKKVKKRLVGFNDIMLFAFIVFVHFWEERTWDKGKSK